jgi:hypothetical protein
LWVSKQCLLLNLLLASGLADPIRITAQSAFLLTKPSWLPEYTQGRLNRDPQFTYAFCTVNAGGLGKASTGPENESPLAMRHV